MSANKEPEQSTVEAWASRLIRWAEINSGSGNLAGLRRMAAELEQAFGELGGHAEVLHPAGFHELDGTLCEVGPVLRVTKRSDAPLQILLSGHMDTVYGEGHTFQRTEWLEPGVLRGPGVADMKGGLLLMLETLRSFEQKPESSLVGWEVLITSDEEIGSHASRDLIEDAARRNRFGLVFESAVGTGAVVRNRKGNGSFRLEVQGRAAHTGRAFEAGRNAIVALSRSLQDVHALNGEFGDATFNVGRVSGGGPLNVVPDYAEAYLNIRISHNDQMKPILGALEAIVEKTNAHDGFKARLSGDFTRPPKQVDESYDPVFDAARAAARSLGIELDIVDTGGSSDGNLLHACGLPHLDGVGAVGGDIHSSAEFIRVDRLWERMQLNVRILCELARQAASTKDSSK